MNNYTSLVKESKVDNCFICTCLDKQIYLNVRLSEKKSDGMEGNLIGKN